MGLDPDPGQPVFLLLRLRALCIGKAFVLSGFATSIQRHQGVFSLTLQWWVHEYSGLFSFFISIPFLTHPSSPQVFTIGFGYLYFHLYVHYLVLDGPARARKRMYGAMHV